MSNLLKVSQLTKVFDPTTIPIEAVKDVDLELHEGEITVITGRSGSGKSTLLHLIAGLEEKTSGNIKFKDNESYKNIINFSPTYILISIPVSV